MNTAFPQHGAAIDLDRYRRADRWRTTTRARAASGRVRAVLGAALVTTGRRLLAASETPRAAVGGDPCR